MVAKKTLKGEASIVSNNGYLRISLPRNLYNGQQKYIGLGLKDTSINRAKAQVKLKQVQRDISLECFDLSLANYSDKPSKFLVNQVLVVKDWMDAFEEKYFLTKQRNRQSLKTFKVHLYFLHRYLSDYLNVPLTEKIITDVISATGAGTPTRMELVKTLSVFCKAYKFKYDFTDLSNGYKPKARILPKDESIVSAYNLIQEGSYCTERFIKRSKSWGWILMVVATYGLRPHELFAIDYEKSFKKQDEYALFLNADLTDGLKTGSRRVYPIPIQWVEEFDLTNIKNEILIKFKNPITNFHINFNNKLQEKRKALGCSALKECLNFVTYDLRHRYAIRGHELGYPVEAMARWMGHSIITHTGKYQKWLKEDTDKLVFQNANFKSEELKRSAQGLPSYEALEAKIKLLKEENEVLKQKLNSEDFINT